MHRYRFQRTYGACICHQRTGLGNVTVKPGMHAFYMLHLEGYNVAVFSAVLGHMSVNIPDQESCCYMFNSTYALLFWGVACVDRAG